MQHGPLAGDGCEQLFLWRRKFGESFFHQAPFQLLYVHDRIEFVEDRLRGELVDLPSKFFRTGSDSFIGIGRIGLDIAARQRGDILPW